METNSIVKQVYFSKNEKKKVPQSVGLKNHQTPGLFLVLILQEKRPWFAQGVPMSVFWGAKWEAVGVAFP